MVAPSSRLSMLGSPSHVASSPVSAAPRGTCTCRPSVRACAEAPQASGQRTSKRLQQLTELAELDLDAGWGVQPVAPPAHKPQPGASNKAQQQANGAQTGAQTATRPARVGKKAVLKAAPAQPPAAPSKPARTRSPYVDLQSEQGVMGLALLQARLARGEAGTMSPEEIQTMKGKIAEARAIKAAGGAPPTGLKGVMAAAAAQAMAVAAGQAGGPAKAAVQGRQRKRVVYVDDDDNIIGEEEDEAEDITDTPSFSLTIGESDTEFKEYDSKGNVIQRSTAQFERSNTNVGLDADLEEEEEEELDFSGGSSNAWRALGTAQGRGQRRDDDDDDELDLATGAPLSARQMEALLGGEGDAGSGSLLRGREQEEEQQEWGLEEIRDRRSETLMEQLGVVKRRRGVQAERRAQQELAGTLEGDGAGVQWGGTGLSTPAGSDIAEQEALLARMFKPHKVKELLAHQKAAYDASLELKRGTGARGKYGDEAKLHRSLRVVAGSAANRRLLSSQGSQTRPMMEKVRAAIFNMILSQAGSTSDLPPNSRWLDLFAGTGSVGIEALSRGAALCHFVEMDPWVCRNILGANLTTCGFQKRAVVHGFKAESFLRRAAELPRFAGGAFDFISVCPPYLLVSYPELFTLLEASNLIHENTILFVEYPSQLSEQVPERLGPLEKVRDRKYGRTWIAVYAPASAGSLTRARGAEDWGDEVEI